MIGTFSTAREEGAVDNTLAKVRITSETVSMIEIRGCRAEEQVFVELPWEPRGNDTIAIVRPEDNVYLAPYEEYRWTRTSCDEIVAAAVTEGGEQHPGNHYVRGDMCLHYPIDPPPPCPPNIECDDPCQTIWCDGPPPPCED